MAAAAIETRGLTRNFGGVPALRGVDFTLAPGEAVALFGPNGAGKSTLLRLCATLLRPSSGSVKIFGADGGSGNPQVRRRTGFLSHQSFLYPDLTPMENLSFYARMFGVADPPHRVHDVIEQVGLVGWANRPVRTLSRGLEQRCALARALLHEPDLLLLDEPFTGLDVNASAILRAVLDTAHRRGAALVMTTHDVAQGLASCRRAVILARGKLVWDGAVASEARDEFERRLLAVMQQPPRAAA
ncbi:MAG TPA: heme ABC exporter ATP-binding protein CcmA [Candidatus Binatia bacterium]|nr:heme ABC exporter ATP-binding protein CcmA [Candidatus Binatia bacterium]